MYGLDDQTIGIYFTTFGVWVNGTGPKSQNILYQMAQGGEGNMWTSPFGVHTQYYL